MRTSLRLARGAALLLVVLWAALFVAVRRGWMVSRPSLLASLAVVAAAAFVAMLVLAAWRVARGPHRIAALAEALAAGGLLAVASFGFTNWARGYQGFVAVAEREPVKLGKTADLDAFQAGPLADLKELDLTIGLARLRMEGAGPDGFRAVSRLKVLDGRGEEVGLDVSVTRSARFRSVVFSQGAFGFAPHVVVARHGRKVLDTYVPFRTLREGPDGVAFVGDMEIEAEGLLLHGALTLDDLNEDMKGHPRLELVVEQRPDPIGGKVGQGNLKPGEYATLSSGVVIGFTGLRRWAEIDFVRRTYRTPMLASALVFAVGLLLWPVAAWRRW